MTIKRYINYIFIILAFAFVLLHLKNLVASSILIKSLILRLHKDNLLTVFPLISYINLRNIFSRKRRLKFEVIVSRFETKHFQLAHIQHIFRSAF